MIKNKKKTKKKILLNGIPMKVDYEVYQVLNNQETQLRNHDAALVKFIQIYEAKDKPNDDEEILYEYCMQLESVVHTLNYLNEQKNESSQNINIKK